MNHVELQIASESTQLPTQQMMQHWVDAVLTDSEQDSELVVRIVDEAEMQQFNLQYRDKQGTTNILSFPFDSPQGLQSELLGDLLVCAPVVEKEAKQQQKTLLDHWAHMIIHGVLHLIGYDHIKDDEAEEMEALEIKILNTINIKNPYEEKNNK